MALPMEHAPIQVYSRDMQIQLSGPQQSRRQQSFVAPAPAPGDTSPSTRPVFLAKGYTPDPDGRFGSSTRQDEHKQLMASIVTKARNDSARAQAREDVELQKMLWHSEQEEEGFVKDVDKFLSTRDRSRTHRKHKLHKDWHDKVYTRIQSQIDDKVDALTDKEIGDRRRDLMDQYIRTANTKTYGLYRDIIIESEYDPLAAQETFVRYPGLPASADPVKVGLREASPTLEGGARRKDEWDEEQIGRPTLNPVIWDKLESTPYGRFNRLQSTHTPMTDSSAALQEAREGEGKGVANSFNHYDWPKGKNVYTNSEFPRSKKTFLVPDSKLVFPRDITN